MKQVSLKKNMLWLRICILTVALVIASLFLFSFKLAEKRADDFWKQLGLSQSQGSEKIKSSFMYGYLDTWGVRNIKSIAASDRATLAKSLLAYTKTYMNSAPVKIAFEKERVAAKPAAPELKMISKEEIRQEKIAEIKKGIKNAEEMGKKFPDMEKSVRKTITEFNKSLKEFENPNNETIEMFYQSNLNENKRKEEQYQKRLKEWEENYPANYRNKIKKHLERYLELAGTVDFTAELKEKNGLRVFVKPDFERKPADWKMIYRAGKEVYEVTKPFAQQWLKEL